MEIISKKKAKPRKEVSLQLITKPNSAVYILAVDRGVNILKSGNDLTKPRVLEELRAYNAYKFYDDLKITGNKNDNRYMDIGKSNAFILTNAYNGITNCATLIDSRTSENAKKKLNLLPSSDPEDDVENIDDFDSMVRSDFPETWLFEKVDVGASGNETISRIVPDSITSWDITAFTLSSQHGLGIAETKVLTVTHPFFVILNLPYAIRVGEILKLDVLLFNYLPKQFDAPVNVTVFSTFTVDKTPETVNSVDDDEDDDQFKELLTSTSEPSEAEFDFYSSSKEDNNCRYSKLDSENKERKMTKRVDVLNNAAGLAEFFIKATKSGLIKIRVRAEFNLSGFTKTFSDEVVQTLRVEYEGLTQYGNEQHLVDLRELDKTGHSFDIPTLEKSQNSLRIHASVIGELAGPVLHNVHDLM